MNNNDIVNNNSGIDSFEKVRELRDVFLKLLACAGAGIIVMLLGRLAAANGSTDLGLIVIALGFAVFAAPLVIVLGLGIPVIDIGPIFRAVDTPVGGFIQRTFVPDIAGQISVNLFLSIIKAMLVLVISVILMPILLAIAFIGYKVRRRKALKYANENGISEKEIPSIPMIIFPIFLGIVVVLLIIISVVGNAYDKKMDAKYEKNQNEMTEKFEAFIETVDDLPEEYYLTAYKGENYTGGFAAQFEVDGVTVRCGKTAKPLYDYPDVLGTSSIYYIIDGKLYIDYYNTNSFTECKDKGVIKILEDRFPEAFIGDDMTFVSGIGGDGYGNEAMEGATYYLEVEYNGGRKYIHLDDDGNLIGFSKDFASVEELDKMTETQFAYDNDENIDSYKYSAEKLIDGTAEIK